MKYLKTSEKILILLCIFNGFYSWYSHSKNAVFWEGLLWIMLGFEIFFHYKLSGERDELKKKLEEKENEKI